MDEKKWGEYNTLGEGYIDNLTEYEHWLVIEELGGRIFYGQKNRPQGSKESIETLMEWQYNLEFLVYNTSKYGVTFDYEPSVDKHVPNNPDYHKWYQFWNAYFSNMSVEEHNEFIAAKQEGRDLTPYLPSTKWNEEDIMTL